MENVGADRAGGSAPVADDLAVKQEDGPEDAAVVVGAVTVVGMEGQLAALVADKVFVVGGEQVHEAAAKSSGAPVLMPEKLEALPTLPDELCADGIHALLAGVDAEAAPPGEVLQGGGAVAAEVFPGQQGEGFFPGEGSCRG